MRITDLDNLLELAPAPGVIDPNIPPEELEDEPEVTEPEVAEPEVAEPEVAEPQPAIAPPTEPTSTTSIGKNLEPELFMPPQAPSVEPTKVDLENIKEFEKLSTSLLTKAKKLSTTNPVRRFAYKILFTFSGLTDNLQESIEPTELKLIQASSMSMMAVLERKGFKTIAEAVEFMRQADQLATDALAIEASQSKEYQKAHKSHEAYIKLTAFEELVKQDEELEAFALKISNKLNLPMRWARNLIGMFGAKMDKFKRNSFMAACENGTALDLNAMMSAGQGNVDTFVAEGDIREVYSSIKTTLLDISLSDGQGAATGPFEALLAIMGGAVKAKEGDLLINGQHYEVKSGSIRPVLSDVKSGKSINGAYSNAWLDSGGEQSPASARAVFTGQVANYSPNVKVPTNVDFRPQSLENMRKFLISRKIAANSKTIIYEFHKAMYPDLAKAKISNYSLRSACGRIFVAIMEDKADVIAREQGIMAMLQYNLGHYQANFILYNSSTQTFRVINGAEGIASLLKEQPSAFGVNFLKQTITISGKSTSTRKSAPGIYFGPLMDSPEAEAYLNEKRKEAGITLKISKGQKTADAWNNGIDTGGYLPGNELGEPVGRPKKTTVSKKRALKEVDSFLLDYFVK
jgi:hypothetical protein